jgi:hypothetical protein
MPRTLDKIGHRRHRRPDRSHVTRTKGPAVVALRKIWRHARSGSKLGFRGPPLGPTGESSGHLGKLEIALCMPFGELGSYARNLTKVVLQALDGCL